MTGYAAINTRSGPATRASGCEGLFGIGEAADFNKMVTERVRLIARGRLTIIDAAPGTTLYEASAFLRLRRFVLRRPSVRAVSLPSRHVVRLSPR
jgi:hypothetical protein